MYEAGLDSILCSGADQTVPNLHDATWPNHSNYRTVGMNVLIDPLKPNWISHYNNFEQLILMLGVLGGIFLFFPNFKRRLCKQTVKLLCIMWCLIWICIVCLCPIKRTLDLYGLDVGNVIALWNYNFNRSMFLMPPRMPRIFRNVYIH